MSFPSTKVRAFVLSCTGHVIVLGRCLRMRVRCRGVCLHVCMLGKCLFLQGPLGNRTDTSEGPLSGATSGQPEWPSSASTASLEPHLLDEGPGSGCYPPVWRTLSSPCHPLWPQDHREGGPSCTVSWMWVSAEIHICFNAAVALAAN